MEAPNRMLTQSARGHMLCRVTRETSEKARSGRIGFPSRFTRRVRPASLAPLSCAVCHTCGPSSVSRGNIVVPQPSSVSWQ